MDLEDERDSDEAENENEVDLTGFLFGNIDSDGRLVDDIFDNESKKLLGSLGRMGLNNMLSEVIKEDEAAALITENGKPEGNNSPSTGEGGDTKSSDSDEDYDKKSDTAIDYSDINELAEDVQSAMPPPANKDEGDDYDEETENKDDESKKSSEEPDSTSAKSTSSDDKTGDSTPPKDNELMPPPSAPSKSQLNYDSVKSENTTSNGPGSEEESSTIATINGTTTNASKQAVEKKLETPLAAMLPSKYANVDVRELFPDFRPDKVLRFSRLFGPGKPSSLPQIWRSVRKRRGRRKNSREDSSKRDGSDSTSESDERSSDRKSKGFNLTFGPEPTKAQTVSDDEDRLLSEVSDQTKEKAIENNESGDQKQKIADWRFGPAQVWYDMLDVAESGEGFNYGFKLRDAKEEEDVEIKGELIPDDAYLMVSQLHWEDDVVWDGNDIKHKVMQKLNSKTNAAGWLPSSGSRTAGAFSQPGKGMANAPVASGSSTGKTSKASKALMLLQKAEEVDDTWYSIFPVENEELVYSKWEDEVIWDAEAMTKIPKPKVLTLDPNDENIILGIPDDIDPSKVIKNTRPPPKVKIPHPHVKKSKILLGKAGVINVLAEDTPPPPPKSPDRDPFNISNDIFYAAKSSETTIRMKVGGGNLIQHSTPVVELRAPFVPTHMGPMKLRAFHRPAAKKYSHGAIAGTEPHGVYPLAKHIKKKSRQRELERIASGGGDVFFMRNPEDLSGKDGEIILVEFCEEHPPLMNQVGMCSKIKNYYKRKAAKDVGPPEFRYGEIAYAHTSPFLGILQQGHCIQTVENNMYRTPIYEHKVATTDFLLIRTRNNYFVREIDGIFTAGQECPLYEVPGPNSKRANNFVRDFLQVFIYRLFWKSRDMPRRIRMDDIKRAFPGHSESSIRKRLKQCADFKRTGMDSNWWVIKPEFRLPSEEEIRAMVSPEQCCAYFSMIAAEQRLKDAGYGEKFLFAPQDDDDEEMQLKMDDEVKVAPWNTTRAYIQAMRGKCLLQLTGPADPTGCGEGFSYVRIPNKPTQSKEEQEAQPKRTVTGTDADLRRLSLSNAKALLRKFQVPEEEIKKLTRWEVIDVVRTLSTEKAKQGEVGMDKFSRGNRFSIAEHQERYKEECQRIFDLQNRVLASEEVLSTDEGESTASEESDKEDLEELGKNLENMLDNKKTSMQLSLEREEQERQELVKKIMEEREAAPKGSKKKDDDSIPSHLQPGRILKITRTFKNAEGKEYTRVEIVRRPQVIDAYVRIRSTKDENFIRQFATLDEAQKEEMKREKRRIQEQLRRIKRNQEKGQNNQFMAPNGQPIQTLGGEPLHSTSSKSRDSHGGSQNAREGSTKASSPSRRKSKMKPDLKMKCGACQQVGHMRTNKACPLYTGSQVQTPSLSVAVTEEEEEEVEKDVNCDEEEENLVNVDGTKMKLSGKLLKRHDEGKRRTLLLKLPKDAMKNKRRRVGTDVHCDYLKKHNKTTNRRRTDPVVVLLSILEQILNELRDMPDVQPFLFPVNVKLVPDYFKYVTRPMDLQTMRENLRQRKYQNREDFLADVNQILENSIVYNGAKSPLTAAAERMLKTCGERLNEREERLIRLEKAINPLLDDDDQVSLSFIFKNLVTGTLKTMPESWPFLKPVNKKQVKDYYTVIRRPMDLETISTKIDQHKYHSRAEFIADIELIAQNCEQYNGIQSNFTQQARIMVDVTKEALAQFDEHCASLEKNIAAVQQRHTDDDAWLDDEHNQDDLSLSRNNSSPDNDFVDVEGNGRPLSGASGSSTTHRAGPSIIPALPEMKRGRGRPRKNRDDLEDANIWRIKRGRGRPRNDSSYSKFSFKTNSYLEEDLQFSTDDEEFEEVGGKFDPSTAAVLGQGEGLARSAQPINYPPGGHGEDGSQQAAEAMVQLAGVGFYGQQDESIDVDPNYDPSDFLKLASSIKVERPDPEPMPNEDEQQMDSYEITTYEQLQPHQLKDEVYEMPHDQEHYQHQQYHPDGQPMYDDQMVYQQQPLQQQVVYEGDHHQQQYMMYDDHHQPQYGQLQPQPIMNVSDNMMYQNLDAGGQVLHQLQQHPDTIGEGIDEDLAVSDSDDEGVLNVGNPSEQQFDATEPEPPPPPPAAADVKKNMDVDPDDDGGDLWF